MRVVAEFDEWALLAAFFCSLLFVGVCTVVWRWWRTSMGRTVVSISVALSLAMLPAALHYVFGLSVANVWFAGYYGCSLLLVAGIELRRAWAVWSEQRAGEPKPGGEGVGPGV